MDPTLEFNAGLLKGFILSHQPPQEIMEAFNSIVTIGRRPGAVISQEVTPNERLAASLEAAGRALFAKPATGFPVISLSKRPRRCKLSAADHLAEIQLAHDGQPDSGILPEPNGIIAKRYDVSDQTIVNFLKRYGKYTPTATGGRPKKDPADRAKRKKKAPSPAPVKSQSRKPEPTDIMGEKLITVAAPAPIKPDKKAKRSNPKESPIPPACLVDCHEMLRQGKTLDDIAEFYRCSRQEAEAFILQHRNATITTCAPGYAANSILNNQVKPSMRGRGGD